MNEYLISFLIEKYGKRVDHPQPLIDTGDIVIQNQLDLVDKNISSMHMQGILWTIIGVFWLIFGIISVVREPDALYNLIQIVLGFSAIMLGFYNLYLGSDFKKKKVILETILFINSKSI